MKKVIYFLIAIAIGVACLFSFMIFAFNFGNGFLSNNNNPLAISVALITIVGVTLFLIIGYVVFKSKATIIAAFLTILLVSFLTIPTIEVIDEIKDNARKQYAKNNESLEVMEINKKLNKYQLPVELDIKTSNYETLYYDDLIRLQFEKIGEDALETKEIETLFSILPLDENGYRVGISFGKYNPEYGRKISSIAIFLDHNHEPSNCYVDVDNYHLCNSYKKQKR